MVNQLKDIRQFAERWKLPLAKSPTFEADVVRLYQTFFHEELQTELSEAETKETSRERLTHTTDCLIDALVFIFQLANRLGIDAVLQLAWDEVHRSNQTKGDAESQTLADATGKWIKGEHYSRPNLKDLFENGVMVSYQPSLQVVASKLAILLQKTFPTVTVDIENGSLTAQDSDLASTHLASFLAKEAASFGMRLRINYPTGNPEGPMEFVLEEDVSIAQLDAYQGWVKRVAQYPSGLVYTASGLASEGGEVLGVVQKVMRRLNSSQVSASDLGHKAKNRLLDELSDVLFYLVATANELGITVEHLVEVNRQKIEERIKLGTVYASA